MLSKISLRKNFSDVQPSYVRLGINLEQAIQSFLDLQEISHLSVGHRIKKFESFYEKVYRKNYKKPFEEVEDICGVRIICYYISDIDKIKQIIETEFEILENQDKSEMLGLKEFAYRSIHYIVKIKSTWTDTPNYRGLESFKAEIQIRTILMHAWAEIEHKLNYKSDSQVPNKFQRKLFRLSAKFEEADEQFEELRDGIYDYRRTITEKAKSENKFDIRQDFNRDSYLAFLNFHFPNKIIDNFNLDFDLDNYINLVTFEDLEEIVQKGIPYINEIAKDLKESNYSNDLIEKPTEFIAFLLNVFGKLPFDGTINAWKKNVVKWKKKLLIND